MFWRKFGLAEAKKADEFVRTEDQRRVVLGIARMFNIPVRVKSEASKERLSLLGNRNRHRENASGLKIQISQEELSGDVAERQRVEVNAVAAKWAL